MTARPIGRHSALAASYGRQAPGAYLVNGMLFFRLLDGTSINCGCIGHPYAQAVVDLFNSKAPAATDAAQTPDWRSFCATGEELG